VEEMRMVLRLGDEERRLMHLVPAPAVKLMKRRVLSRPGVDSVSVVPLPLPFQKGKGGREKKPTIVQHS
jgi:hypothetical protein